MDGVLVVDKLGGMTSHDVVDLARRSLGERRIGHTGTLDPLATGVLPLACGRATRLVRFFLSSDKAYEATIRFGLTTDTYDITGRELTRSTDLPTPEAIEAALDTLRGEYLQTPPAYSAKKVGGRRAYALARQDTPVVLAPVPVRVSRADLLQCTDESAHVAITCSAGFYVRSFAHALGERVGSGACLEALRRTRSGDFALDEAIDLETLRHGPDASAHMIPLEQLLPGMPAARLSSTGRARISHGQEVESSHMLALPSRLEAGAADTPDADGYTWVRLFDDTGQLVALGRRSAAGPTDESLALHPAVVLI